jgi:hypothetical protein
MTSTFNINDNYSIDLSLNTHENHIYILIVNKTSNKSYENIIRPTDIMNNTFNIESIHKIIVKCFDTNENTDYTFNINCYGDSIKLSFTALVDKFLGIGFDICLTEKKISSDDELSLSFNKLNIKLRELEKTITEQRNNFEHKITQQEKQIINLENNLSNCVVNLLQTTIDSDGARYAINLLVPIYLSELDFTDKVHFPYIQHVYNYIDYEKIDHLYKLKKLKLIFYSYSFSTSLAKSKTVEHLTICCHSYCGFQSRPTTYEFTGLEHFPNLKHLCVESSEFSSKSFVGNLKSFKHNIKKIELISCTNHNNPELENYCRNNKIEILIK